MIVSRKITISRNFFLTNSIVALVLLCCSVSFVTAEECGGSGDTIVLQSQRQVDNFNNDCGDCTKVASAPEDRRLPNLNYINSESFFNFSRYQSGS